MVDITPLIQSDRMVIQGYSSGHFKISGTRYEGPVLVFPDRTIPWNTKADAESLTAEDFSQLFSKADTVDVILWGCGNKAVFCPPSFKAKLKEKGLVLEVMGTGAACRTYNVLLAEGRRVVAALLPVSS